MSVLDGPGEGTWSVFAAKVVEERDELRAEVERLQRLLDHATQTNPGTSTLVMLMNEASLARAERDLIKNHYSAEAAAKLRAELASARAEVEMLRERLLEVERTPNGAGKWNAERVLREKAEARARRARLDFANACDVGRRQEARAAAAERERDEARADFDSLEDAAAKVVLAYRNGDKIELDEAVESLASNGRPQWWENAKPIGLRGESDDQD
jgi:site-specific recombinase